MKRVIITAIGLLVFEWIAFAQFQSSKKGIAFGYLTADDIAEISKGMTWWYNWAVVPENGVKDIFGNYNMDFVPMAWNGLFDETSLRAFYETHPDTKYLLGFNEPNFQTQANLTPREAAALWPKLEAIAKDFNLKIVGPAVNYCDKCIVINGVAITDPVQYLDSFFAACPACQVDYIAVHNYMCYSGALSSYIERFKKYNKKIWLTEFACWDQANITLDMQKSYILGALDYLENDTMILRYSWFNGSRTNNYPYISLLKPQSGVLTELGNLYVTYYPVHDTSIYTDIPARIEAEAYNAMYGVSIEGVKDVDGIADVGWIDAGDWLEYNINVPENREYYVFFRIASNANTSLEVLENGSSLDTLQVPSSGGWQNWRTLEMPLALSQGKHKLRIFTGTGKFNLNWIMITDNPNSNPDAFSENQGFIYPNPVTDILNIQSDDLIPEATVSIINQTGIVMLTKEFQRGTNSMSIDVSNLISGFYFVKVKNQSEICIYKLVIQ
jgi:Glycosyl hydrolase catalytic core/Carbohydrate binding module (family 6)/Secretion system C-terminal sorting domain